MSSVECNISEDLVKPIIEAKIKATMVEVLGAAPRLVEEVVGAILNTKVNAEGKVSSSSYDNKHKFIDAVLMQAIQESCREAVKEFVTQKRPLIEAEVQRQLATKKNMTAFTKAMLDGIVKATESQWKFSTNFKFETDED